MIRGDVTLLTPDDRHLFNEGTHRRIYDKLGAHIVDTGERGTAFAVWAPNAEHVSVIGDLNGWEPGHDPLRLDPLSGVWEGFIPGVGAGARYKYHVRSRHRDYRADKADPLAFHTERAPLTGSVVWDLTYEWRDSAWMDRRARHNAPDAPWSIYEVHLGSWMRGDGDRMLGYEDLADRLADYTVRMGFTHVELMPVAEHPFYGSWGYQATGFFAPTSRYGTPQDFMRLVERLHQAGVGVILDWVPSHFPGDEHGLAYFDGTHLYEHADPRLGFHPEWNSYIFNYGRHEVRSFLVSSALFWLDKYHVDALRVDAVASMLYLDYARGEGQWTPNRFGGRENLEAIDFLRALNEAAYADHPGTQTIAEDSTNWPLVSRPTHLGGLGFGMKWDMGWMHDTLDYFALDPIYRKHHHNDLTFRNMYAFSENYVLPLSHDEVVYGKRSLLSKMPGDEWQQFANLRLLLAMQMAQPGKKLLFMGGELAQRAEWDHDRSLDWHLLELPRHAGVQRLVADLNHMYAGRPGLHELDFDAGGFEWVDFADWENSIIAFLRHGRRSEDDVLAVFNFTPVPRYGYALGVPQAGQWRELVNTDAPEYGGSGLGNLGGVATRPSDSHHRPFAVDLVLPPLAALFLTPARD